MDLDGFQLLLDIERRAHLANRRLPRKAGEQTVWRGIGFRLGSARLASSLHEIQEILTYPPVTRVHATPSWMKGIANVRGVLLPIADLSSVLGGPSLAIDARSRVLSVNDAEASVGLLVDEVYGVKHFRKEEQVLNAQTTREHGLSPYLHDTFAQGGVQWSIFSMTELVAKDTFKRFIL